MCESSFRYSSTRLMLRTRTKSGFCPSSVGPKYTEYRLRDVQEMTDMAAEYYDESGSGSRSRASRTNKQIETFFCKYAPWLDWTFLYTRIHFGNERFFVLTKERRSTKADHQVLLSCSVPDRSAGSCDCVFLHSLKVLVRLVNVRQKSIGDKSSE